MKAYSVKTQDNTLIINIGRYDTVNAHFDEISSIKYDKGCFLVYLNDGKVAKFEVPESVRLFIMAQLGCAIMQQALYMSMRKSYRGQFAPCDDGHLDQLREWGVRV